MSNARPLLTYEEAIAAFLYDPETGAIHWRISPTRSVYAGDLAGTVNKDGYLIIGYKRRIYASHRLVWLLMTGEWPTLDIDHKDLNQLNNRWVNLRHVTRQVNAQNKRWAAKTSSTGLLGVSKSKSGKWTSSININGTRKHLGTFETPESAHAAYVTEKRLHHAGCTL